MKTRFSLFIAAMFILCTASFCQKEDNVNKIFKAELEQSSVEFSYGEVGTVRFRFSNAFSNDVNVSFTPEPEAFSFVDISDNNTGLGIIRLEGRVNTDVNLEYNVNIECGKTTITLPLRVKINHKDIPGEKPEDLKCVKPDTDKVYIDHYLGTETTFTVESLGDYSYFTTGDWTGDWFTVERNGNEFKVKAGYNKWTVRRTGSITFTQDGLEPVVLPVEQEERPYSESDNHPHGYKGSIEEVHKEALMAFYYMNDGPNWKKINRGDPGRGVVGWSEDIPVEEGWSGIGRWHDKTHWWDGTIQGIGMGSLLPDDYKAPTGGIPEEFGNLIYMEDIDIRADNHTLCGKLPQSLRNLTRCRNMVFQQHHLEGTLDEMEWLKVLIDKGILIELELCLNNLTGSIPDWIGTMLKNNIPRGEENFGLVDHAKRYKGFALYFMGNRLSGQVPESFFNLPFMQNKIYYQEFDKEFYRWEEQFWQQDDYALWVGEKPDNVIRVGDHWEWKPGTNPYAKFKWERRYEK